MKKKEGRREGQGDLCSRRQGVDPLEGGVRISTGGRHLDTHQQNKGGGREPWF